eukprot:CAMPEP_0181172842 /NCGR_PEP_ID=MMETSP1096-20121128/2665_1 /TAXON_ID=156174 ORGANISM="Chrysochromulina ericina, Strain CCMP281" /NCGR_SAMPLE_ID=MMETSP1096 /ASSEMBLY_ACC=CAM_ASM_000453 /LENGTH=65 /DNA_ID=CAMNT_0023260597 /DNA_START=95 /DNA_END=292 /DNA_ORIENTATION=+
MSDTGPAKRITDETTTVPRFHPRLQPRMNKNYINNNASSSTRARGRAGKPPANTATPEPCGAAAL